MKSSTASSPVALPVSSYLLSLLLSPALSLQHLPPVLGLVMTYSATQNMAMDNKARPGGFIDWR